MIEKYAWHTGYADLLCERVDNSTADNLARDPIADVGLGTFTGTLNPRLEPRYEISLHGSYRLVPGLRGNPPGRVTLCSPEGATVGRGSQSYLGAASCPSPAQQDAPSLRRSAGGRAAPVTALVRVMVCIGLPVQGCDR
jgi:hypothetical protein